MTDLCFVSYICLYNMLNHMVSETSVQEMFAIGEDVGKLDCGHDYHTNCIKQWLMQKNLCPICKTTGLAT